VKPKQKAETGFGFYFMAPGVGLGRARQESHALACPGLANICRWQMFDRSAARMRSRLASNPFSPHS